MCAIGSTRYAPFASEPYALHSRRNERHVPRACARVECDRCPGGDGRRAAHRRGADPRLPRPHRRARFRSCGPLPTSIPSARLPRRGRATARGSKGPLHGLPFGVKDIIDTHDMPTRLRLADPCGSSAALGCGVRCAGARSRRRHAGQDGHHRVRVAPSRADREPAQSRAHARRIVERIGGSRRRLHGAGGLRHANRRVDHPSRVVLRRGRLQALVQHDQPDRREAARQQLRYRRALRPMRR